MGNEMDQQISAELDRAVDTGDFEKVVRCLEQMEARRALSARELVLKARSLQLGSGTAGDELQKAEAALKAALELDGEYVAALIELGWFYYAVADDTAQAKGLFEKAFDIAARDCNEALAGLFKAIEEVQSEFAARQIVAKRARHAIDMSKIDSNWRERFSR